MAARELVLDEGLAPVIGGVAAGQPARLPGRGSMSPRRRSCDTGRSPAVHLGRVGSSVVLQDPAVDQAASLLADPLRMRIISLLAREPLCTCHLMAETGARQTTVSHHLRLLRDAGWVEPEPQGRFTYYHLRPEGLEFLAASVAALGEVARERLTRARPC